MRPLVEEDRLALRAANSDRHGSSACCCRPPGYPGAAGPPRNAQTLMPSDPRWPHTWRALSSTGRSSDAEASLQPHCRPAADDAEPGRLGPCGSIAEGPMPPSRRARSAAPRSVAGAGRSRTGGARNRQFSAVDYLRRAAPIRRSASTRRPTHTGRSDASNRPRRMKRWRFYGSAARSQDGGARRAPERPLVRHFAVFGHFTPRTGRERRVVPGRESPHRRPGHDGTVFHKSAPPSDDGEHRDAMAEFEEWRAPRLTRTTRQPPHTSASARDA
jgi:hypothetical protein